MNNKRPAGGLTLFFSVTFLFSWACWFATTKVGGPAMSFPAIVPYLAGAAGPSVGALVVRIRRARLGEAAPVHAVPSRGKRLLWTVPFLVLAVGSVILSQALLGAGVDFGPAVQAVAVSGGPVAFLLLQLLGGPLPEEAGWRGTAYPRLRDRMGRVPATLLLGVIWSVWHLPLFFVPGTMQNAFGLAGVSGLLYLASVLPVTVLTCIAYERGGFLASVAVHLGANATMSLLMVSTPAAQASLLLVQGVLALLLLATPQRKRTAEPALSC